MARRRPDIAQDSSRDDDGEELTEDEVMELVVAEVKAVRAEFAAMTPRQRRRERRRTRSFVRRARLRLFVRRLLRR